MEGVETNLENCGEFLIHFHISIPSIKMMAKIIKCLRKEIFIESFSVIRKQQESATNGGDVGKKNRKGNPGSAHLALFFLISFSFGFFFLNRACPFLNDSRNM